MKQSKSKTRTKEKLYTAFQLLADEQLPRKISVDLLCSKADIHRNTFYHYFESMLGFLSQYIIRYRTERIEIIRTARSPEELNQLLTEHVSKNLGAMKQIYSSISEETFSNDMFHHDRMYIEQVLIRYETWNHAPIAPEIRNYVIDHLAAQMYSLDLSVIKGFNPIPGCCYAIESPRWIVNYVIPSLVEKYGVPEQMQE